MIEFFNVSLNYHNQSVLKNITFRIKKGDFVYLTGRSGVGKSSILKLIYFDEFPNAGTIIINQYSSSKITTKEIPLLRRNVGVIFQDFKLLNDRNVFDNVAFALRVTGVKSREIRKRVLRLLTEVGLGQKRESYPKELSGGEQQKVAIARALVNNPFILLADEPTGNLDPKASLEIMQLLEKINDSGTAILMATHNEHLIRQFPHPSMELINGEFAEK